MAGQRWRLTALRAVWLAVWGLAAASSQGQAPADPIIGRWQGASGSEQMEIKANGFVRTCFVGNKPGSASMGAWTRLPQGNYRIELSHAITPRCGDGSRMLRRYELSIVGNATVSANELALFVSGEFPPDRFVRMRADPR